MTYAFTVSYWIIREDEINQNKVNGKGVFVCGRRGREGGFWLLIPGWQLHQGHRKETWVGGALDCGQPQILSRVSRALEQRFPGRGCQVGQVWLCSSAFSCSATKCGQPVESSASAWMPNSIQMCVAGGPRSPHPIIGSPERSVWSASMPVMVWIRMWWLELHSSRTMSKTMPASSTSGATKIPFPMSPLKQFPPRSCALLFRKETERWGGWTQLHLCSWPLSPLNLLLLSSISEDHDGHPMVRLYALLSKWSESPLHLEKEY